jgi:hypothetical protein
MRQFLFPAALALVLIFSDGRLRFLVSDFDARGTAAWNVRDGGFTGRPSHTAAPPVPPAHTSQRPASSHAKPATSPSTLPRPRQTTWAWAPMAVASTALPALQTPRRLQVWQRPPPSAPARLAFTISHPPSALGGPPGWRACRARPGHSSRQQGRRPASRVGRAHSLLSSAPLRIPTAHSARTAPFLRS